MLSKTTRDRKRRNKRIAVAFVSALIARGPERAFHAQLNYRTIKRKFTSLPQGNFPDRILEWNRELKCHLLLAMVVTKLQSPIHIVIVSINTMI